MAKDTNKSGLFNLGCGLFLGFGVVAIACWVAFDSLFWRIVVCIYFVGIPTLASLLVMIDGVSSGERPPNTDGFRPLDDWGGD